MDSTPEEISKLFLATMLSTPGGKTTLDRFGKVETRRYGGYPAVSNHTFVIEVDGTATNTLFDLAEYSVDCAEMQTVAAWNNPAEWIPETVCRSLMDEQ